MLWINCSNDVTWPLYRVKSLITKLFFQKIFGLTTKKSETFCTIDPEVSLFWSRANRVLLCSDQFTQQHNKPQTVCIILEWTVRSTVLSSERLVCDRNQGVCHGVPTKTRLLADTCKCRMRLRILVFTKKNTYSHYTFLQMCKIPRCSSTPLSPFARRI